MSITREIGKDTLIYLVFKIIFLLTGFITIPLMAKIFNPDEFGIYSIIITSVSIFTFISSEWIKSSFLRFYNEYKNEDNIKTLISTSFVLLLLVDSIFLIITIIFNFILDIIGNKDLIFLVLLIFLPGLQSISLSYFRIKQQVVKLNIFQLFPKISFFIIFLPLVFFKVFDNNIRALLFSGLFADGLIVLLVVRYFYLNNQLKIRNLKYKLVKDFMKYGFPIALTALISTIFSSSDRYIILYLVNEKATGIYSFAYNLANKSFLLIPQTITMAIWPIILKYSEIDFKYTLNKIIIFQKIYFLLLLPIVLLMGYFSKEIFNIFSNIKYYEGTLFFKYIVYGIFIGSLVWYFNVFFMLKKNTKVMMISYFIATLVNIILNFLLIPIFGYNVAAITTLVSYLIYFFLMAIFVIKVEKIFLVNTIFMITFNLLIIIFFRINLFIWDLFKISEISLFSLKMIKVIPFFIIYFIFIIIFFIKNKDSILN